MVPSEHFSSPSVRGNHDCSRAASVRVCECVSVYVGINMYGNDGTTLNSDCTVTLLEAVRIRFLPHPYLHICKLQTVANQTQQYTTRTLLTIEMRNIEHIREVAAVPHPRLECATHKEVSVVAQDGGVDVHGGGGVTSGAQSFAHLR